MSVKFIKIYNLGNENKDVNTSQICLVEKEKLEGNTLVHLSNGMTIVTASSVEEVLELINR